MDVKVPPMLEVYYKNLRQSFEKCLPNSRLSYKNSFYVRGSPTLRESILEAMPQKFPAALQILPPILEAPPPTGTPNWRHFGRSAGKIGGFFGTPGNHFGGGSSVMVSIFLPISTLRNHFRGRQFRVEVNIPTYQQV